MTDDRDELDPSQWLAAQFGEDPAKPDPEPASPVVPDATAPAQPPPEPYVPPAAPFTPPPIVPPVPPVVPTPPPSPAAPADPTPLDTFSPAGFSWGLTPGADVTPAQPVEPAVPATPAVEPPTEAYVPPAEVYVPPAAAAPDAPTVAFPHQEMETRAFDASGWQAAPLDPALEGVTEVLEAELVGLPVPQGEGLETSAIDSLFGDSKFEDFAGQSMIQIPVRAPDAGAKPPRGPIPRNQKILMWVAGGLVAVLALVGLFVLGTKISGTLGPSPALVPSASPSPSASPAFVLGPVVPGEYQWDALLGGECLDPYESAWQDTYTVVDCTKPHPAQMVFVGTFVDDLTIAFPGVEELQKRINLLCTAPTVIDYAAAGAASDIQVAASYPLDAKDWGDGNRTFYCFVNRAGGEDLTTSIAVPQVAPVPAPLPTP